MNKTQFFFVSNAIECVKAWNTKITNSEKLHIFKNTYWRKKPQWDTIVLNFADPTVL